MPALASGRCAVTLIELLVAIGIVALLLAILLPALGAGRSAAHDLKCRANMKNVLTAFHLFSEPAGAGTRGESDLLGPSMFRLEDFQESIYGIDEFWDGPPVQRAALDPQTQFMMCPAGPGRLERRSDMPCSAGAITPQKNVTLGFNSRLFQRTDSAGFPADAFLTGRILDLPEVPLLFDVDGELASTRGVNSYYGAPALELETGPDIYSSGMFWFPSRRHRNRTNIGFVGLHVLSSSDAVNEPLARWSYQADP